MAQFALSYYLQRHLDGLLTPDEKVILLSLLDDPEQQESLRQFADDNILFWERHPLDFPEGIARVRSQLIAHMDADSPFSSPPVHRVHLLQRWGWAAAVFVLIGASAYLYTTFKKTPLPVVVHAPVESDILPGSKKVILTLSNGSTIILDSASKGEIAQQGNSSVVKNANGEIIYYAKEPSSHEVLINTLSTPKGRQYQIVLPDGSKVWLNAASSLTYPAAFVGNQRKVKVTGEAYIEVTKDKTKPFLIDVDGRSIVQVLGTSFNINSYRDEEQLTITLIEGSVKVSGHTVHDSALEISGTVPNDNLITLKPGQQAVIKDAGSGTIKVDSANIPQVLAWKNGYFNFENITIQEMGRQIERWYDIKVVFEGKHVDMRLNGKMDRGVQLSDITRFFKDYGFKIRLEGRTLVVASGK